MTRRKLQARAANRELFDPDVVPRIIRDSRLFLRGGFDVFEGLLDDAGRAALLREATGQATSARFRALPVSDGEEFRGGRPARCLFSAPGGEIQDAFYRAPWMLDFLRQASGTPIVPTGARGTYSYYMR